LDGLQAAVLSVKLRYLARWTARRRELAAEYLRRLADIVGLTPPVEAPGREHVYHLYVVQHERRDQLARHLSEHRLHPIINYPAALPVLPAYRRLEPKPADFPVAYRHQSRILSLPLYPEMTPAQVTAVTGALKAFHVADE